MKSTVLDEAIYERYIVPSKRKRTKVAGLEFELPIINHKNLPVDFSVVHEVTEVFIREFSFDQVCRDDNGFVYSAIEENTGDGISFDCSYNTLEFSFGMESNLNVLHKRFVKYYTFVNHLLESYDHALTGMGINPHYAVNQNIPVASERYRMLFHHLSSYKKYGKAILFHDHPNFGLFSCASQIQLDVEENDIVETLNTFTKLEPLKALIFANSLWEEEQELLCSRDMLWRNSLHGLNRHNVDMYGVEGESIHEIVSYIRSMSLYCVEREGKYINFPPVPLVEYFASEEVAGEYFDGERYQQICIHPDISDLQYLRSFKFEDLTFRGTVEFRSVCEQPVKEIMASGAFHAGLMENLHPLTELLESDRVIYHRGYNASEIRRMFVKRELPELFDWREVSKLIVKVLELAENGLRKRGFGEEVFLEPLYRRAECLLSPAREMAEGLQAGRSMQDYIEEYGRL
ncbi:MAG: glutamate-cysteine ligase family protein [Roseburia sp.]|nr:glutamate-cysteine ligase family protein [Roseburia sp.]